MKFIDLTYNRSKGLGTMMISGEIPIEFGDSWLTTKTMAVV